MIHIVPLEKNKVKYLVAWNRGKDADFLIQWAGRGYRYPITEEQITASPAADYKIYGIKLDGNLIGTIELMEIDLIANRAKIGRFLLAPDKTGNGYGTKALRLLAEGVFKEMPINRLELTVFDFNKAAVRCYEKAGFKKPEKLRVRTAGLRSLWKQSAMTRKNYLQSLDWGFFSRALNGLTLLTTTLQVPSRRVIVPFTIRKGDLNLSS